mgnify:CR=1 FL=1
MALTARNLDNIAVELFGEKISPRWKVVEVSSLDLLEVLKGVRHRDQYISSCDECGNRWQVWLNGILIMYAVGDMVKGNEFEPPTRKWRVAYTFQTGYLHGTLKWP